MLHHHDHHFQWWHFFPSKEIHQVYLSMALRSLAISLISIFVPMYLYSELGYTLSETLGFFIFFAVIMAVATPFAAKFASQYGLKHSILLSVPFQVAFFFGLHQLKTIPIPLYVIATLEGLAVSFYWMGMHLEFKRVSHRKHRGEEVGKRQAIATLATLFGPVIGGALIKFVSFGVVFLLASVLLAFSALFLFASKEKHVPYRFSVKSLFDKRHWRDASYFTFRGVWVIAHAVLWPLFMFAVLKDYFSLGIIGTIAGLSTTILLLTFGKLSDKKISKRKLVRWVTPFEAVTWLIRGFFTTFGGFVFVSLFQSLTLGLRSAPMVAIEYNRAKKNPVEFFIVREVYICVGRILILTLVLLTAKIVPGFILTGLASLSMFLL